MTLMNAKEAEVWYVGEYDRRTELASTPDEDSGPCVFCGGGLAHYPECPEWPLRYPTVRAHEESQS